MEKCVQIKIGSKFITLLGFVVNSYSIDVKISPSSENYSPFLWEFNLLKKINQGRKRLIHAEDCVGMFLAWTQSYVPSYLYPGHHQFVYSLSGHDSIDWIFIWSSDYGIFQSNKIKVFNSKRENGLAFIGWSKAVFGESSRWDCTKSLLQ